MATRAAPAPRTLRRRDGQPVAQPDQQIAQQLGQTVPPPRAPRAAPTLAIAGTAAAALALLAASTSPAGASAPVVGATTAVAVEVAARSVLIAFDAWQDRRRDTLAIRVAAEITGASPGMTDEAVQRLVDGEIEREKVFQAKARERVRQDLPKALAISDPAERREAVRKVLDRERRFAEQREQAIAERAAGAAAYDNLKSVLIPQAVAGAYWRLNPRLEHCKRCLALAGKVWPWSVLDLFHPPMHNNCGCRLWAPGDAARFGWATIDDVATHDDLFTILHLLEAVEADEHAGDGLWLIEAVAWTPGYLRERALERDLLRLRESFA